MIAEARFDDLAHLALGEGISGSLKFRHHCAGGEGVACGIGLTAGIFAVLVGQLAEERGQRGEITLAGIELLLDLLGERLLLGLFLVAQRLWWHPSW
jgi:hypothetical protein